HVLPQPVPERDLFPERDLSTSKRPTKKMLAHWQTKTDGDSSPAGRDCPSWARPRSATSDKEPQEQQRKPPANAERLSSCPSWARTRTLLIQSQACCQLHQGAKNWT